MTAVRLEGLSKTYKGGIGALRDLSVTIPHGEFVCILGPSGSGKSTVLKLIAGIEEASGGRIFFDAEEVTRTTPERRDVAMVFQSYGLYSHMTVAGNIGFPLKLRKVDRQQRRAQVEEVARLLGIGGLLDRYPRELSGGERQRVALGRAIVRHPKVFLLDEPLSNLDANLRATMRQELKRLHKLLGATFVYVTHDQDDALAMGDRVLVLAEGRLHQFDSASNVYRYPANRFVASFIGRLPMNFFDGALESRGDSLAFVNQDLELALGSQHELEVGAGTPITLGIRPDAVLLRSGARQDAATVKGVVQWLEVIEPELYATIEVGAHRILAKVPEEERAEVGRTAGLSFLSARAHLFDLDTGNRLNRPLQPELPAISDASGART
jgi:multiple sugar transport system ATP-binding protein